MSKRLLKGKLIIIEGPDGVGKSTIATELTKALNQRGIRSEYQSFPGRNEGTLGKYIYDLHHASDKTLTNPLPSASLQTLHIAAHIDAIENIIKPAIDKGIWVILDRFWWSTWVYGKLSNVDQEALELMIKLEETQWKGLLPSVGFVINVKAPHRNNESLSHFLQIQNGYKDLLKTFELSYPTLTITNNESIKKTIKTFFKEMKTLKLFVVPPKESLPSKTITKKKSPLFSTLKSFLPAKTTEVFISYWKFAAERQNIFFKRLSGKQPPWSNDPILSEYKFTNAYRASDRVSQYLIKNVIYKGEQSPEEVFFRTILFKTFNKIETWEYLENKLKSVSYADYTFKRYDKLLDQLKESGNSIYSAAYIMPTGNKVFGFKKKHQTNLKLLELMMDDEVPKKLSDLKKMSNAFELLRSYPLIGDFLAYQYTIDINYSELTNFSEMEFVMPGPGALDGIRKCFSSLGGLSEIDIIKMMADRQEYEFEKLGINFKTLFGRRLQLIDCQNLFCEVDKYARIAHPNIKGLSGRTSIKQKYRSTPLEIEYWYPSKWGINEHIHK